MKDGDKTKRQLMNELVELRTSVAELKEIENHWKKREEVPQSERDELGKVLQNIGVGVAIISRDFRTVWANSVLKKWFGPDIEGKVCHVTYNKRHEICPGCGVHEIFFDSNDFCDSNAIFSEYQRFNETFANREVECLSSGPILSMSDKMSIVIGVVVCVVTVCVFLGVISCLAFSHQTPKEDS